MLIDSTHDQSPARSVARRLAPLYLSTFVGGVALWIPVESMSTLLK